MPELNTDPHYLQYQSQVRLLGSTSGSLQEPTPQARRELALGNDLFCRVQEEGEAVYSRTWSEDDEPLENITEYEDSIFQIAGSSADIEYTTEDDQLNIIIANDPSSSSPLLRYVTVLKLNDSPVLKHFTMRVRYSVTWWNPETQPDPSNHWDSQSFGFLYHQWYWPTPATSWTRSSQGRWAFAARVNVFANDNFDFEAGFYVAEIANQGSTRRPAPGVVQSRLDTDEHTIMVSCGPATGDDPGITDDHHQLCFDGKLIVDADIQPINLFFDASLAGQFGIIASGPVALHVKSIEIWDYVMDLAGVARDGPRKRILATRGRWKKLREFDDCYTPISSEMVYGDNFDSGIENTILFASDVTVTDEHLFGSAYRINNTAASFESETIGYGITQHTGATALADFIWDIGIHVHLNTPLYLRYRTREWPTSVPSAENWGYGMGYEIKIVWREWSLEFSLRKGDGGNGWEEIVSGSSNVVPGVGEEPPEFGLALQIHIKIHQDKHILCVTGENIFTVEDTTYLEAGEFGFGISPVLVSGEDGHVDIDHFNILSYDGSDLGQ